MLSSEEVNGRRHQRERCSDCGGDAFVTDPEVGEVICRRCGLILQEEVLDQTPEWRAFTPEERKVRARVGPPTSLSKFDKGLSTTFQTHSDTSGHTLSRKEQVKMMRLRKWHIRAIRHSSSEQNLFQAMNVLTRLSDKLHIPKKIEEEAALIYRRALSKGLIRGRSIKSIVAASLYAACRLTRTPRSLKTITKASTRNLKEISRNYRLIQRELDLTIPIDDPLQYVSKIASQAGLSQKTQTTAIGLLQKAKQRQAVAGKGPAGVAAAALYIASIMNFEKITQKKLAKAAGVTDVTVRNRYRGLDKSLCLGLRKMVSG